MSDVPTSEHPVSAPEMPSSGERSGDEGRRPSRGGPRPDRPKKRDVSGWVILDKGVGMTSTHAVAVVKRAFNAKKAGHAGTLDPLASGILPIALGEATQDRPVRHGRAQGLPLHRELGHRDRHRRRRGAPGRDERGPPDPRGGRGCAAELRRGDRAGAAALLGDQDPGERAYDLARDGEVVELVARPCRSTASRSSSTIRTAR